MKNMITRHVIFLAVVVAGGVVLSFGCGGSASSPSTPAQVPIDNVVDIADINGATNVATDSAFQYTFEKAVDASTVTASTFYITLASDPSNIITVTISCSSASICTLTPSSDLIGGTSYIITLSSDILHLDGTPFEGFTAAFTTEPGNITISPSVATVAKGSTQQFTAADQNGGDVTSSVTWAVVGGDANGTITSGGLFTPPATIPLNEVVTITASDGSDGSSAAVTITVGSILTFTEKKVFSPVIEGHDMLPDALALALDDPNNIIYLFDWEITPSFDSSHLYSLKSTNGGATFTTSGALEPSDPDELAVSGGVVIDSSGNLDLGYLVNSNNLWYVRFFRGTDEGTSFSDPINIEKPNPTDSDVSMGFLAADPTNDDNIYFMVKGRLQPSPDICTEDLSTCYSEYYLKKSTDAGLNFDNVGEIIRYDGNYTSHCLTSSLAVDANGKVYISYSKVDDGECHFQAENEANPSNIYLVTYDTALSDAVQVNSTAIGGSNLNPRIVIGSDGVIHVIWIHQSMFRTGELTIYYAKGTDGGGSFNTQTAIASPGNFTYTGEDASSASYIPAISIDSMDNINVAYYGWDETNNLNVYLVRSHDGGDSWDPTPVKVNSSINGITMSASYLEDMLVPGISLAVDSAGRVYVSYGLDANDDGLWEMILAAGE